MTAPGFSITNTGFNGAEPTLGVTPDGQTIYVQAGLNTIRSTNSGSAWTEIGPSWMNLATLDPMLYYDPVLDRLYADHLTVECTILARHDNPSGATGGPLDPWIMNPHACGLPAIDHQKLEGGPSPLLGSADGSRSLYLAYSQAGGGAMVAKSIDGGVTWINAVASPSVARGSVLWPTGPVTADPAGTYVYLPHHSPNGLRVSRSANEGLTYSTAIISLAAGAAGHAVDPEVAVDASGYAYVVWWDDADYQLRYSYSTDHGVGWSAPISITTTSSVNSTVFPAVVANGTGKLDVAFYATTNSTAGPDNCATSGSLRCVWYLHTAQITNANTSTPTITITRVNPVNDPIQIGKICTQGTDCASGTRNLLDFIDVKVDGSGSAHIAYTDGCIGSCNAASIGQSGSNRAYYARQTSGDTI